MVHLDFANVEEVDQVELELHGIQEGLVGEMLVIDQLGADVHEAGHRAHLGGQEAMGAGGLLGCDLLGVESGWLRHVCLEIVCINIYYNNSKIRFAALYSTHQQSQPILSGSIIYLRI